ncbi:MAG: hypothetical protein FWH44_04415 [Methanomassiliicoccaceae archaeon]|nr:hypothetical protein [Methanomassiliicoccaceae archaeon]
MSISMAICETECGNALCRRQKENVLKVLVRDPGNYGDAAEFDVIIALNDALRMFGDADGFVKRNKIGKDVCTLHYDMIRDDNDRSVLEKAMTRNFTGWVDVSKMNGADAKALISMSSPEDRQTEWDMLSFDEMGEVCKKCRLSWDKGRGCLGSFGPDNSALPEIASRHGCKITASVPAGVSAGRVYTKDDAVILCGEIAVLRNALAAEGKQAVHRYGGAVDRLEAVAKISAEEGCGFRFF